MRRLLVLALVGCVAALWVAYARRHASRQVAPRPPVSGVAAVVERFECYRCHDAPGKLVPAERPRHCVRCHQDILAGAFDDEHPADVVARWKQRLGSLTTVPSLTGIERRLRREWLIAFLQRPHDLRPDLPASMPRLRIGPDDARAIADHFIPLAPEPALVVALGDPARGRALFSERACAECHDVSGAGLPERAPGARAEAARLAPDLRYARERMTAAAMLAWLQDPAALKPDTLMPRPALSDAERLDVAAFLLEAPLAPPAAPTPPARLPVLERVVHYEEVETRVFKRICWHCHSDPEPVGGDGGPGNTGGFGFTGRGLDLGSHAAVRRGGRDDRGERRDILAPGPDGVPRVVAHLLARHVEVAGGEVPGTLGMPLGLPPMSLEEIQLVETWIAQGAVAPAE